MRTSVLVASSLVVALISTATIADAHISLTSPKPRYPDQKEGPCGQGSSDKRSTNVTTFKPGETITVTWKETIDHPGHFRISFDPNGIKAFVDPKSFTDLNTAPSVLVDGIADKNGGTYSQEVTLPDVECDTCTLQVVQVMTDKAPYGDGNDLYYQCADLVLAKGDDGDAGAGDDAGGSSGTTTPASTSDSGGCATTSRSPGSGAAPIAAALALMTLARQRRRKSAR